jgi:hypothetical protein
VIWKRARGESSPTRANDDGSLPPWRRWRRWLLSLLFALVVGYVFRGFLLAAIAAPLIVDQPVSTPSSVFLLGSSQAIFDEAAALYHKDLASRIFVFRQPPTRTEQIGLAGSASVGRVELAGRGIPDRILSVISCPDRRTWTFAARVHDWLIEHPEDVAVLVCNRFDGRRARWILDHALSPLEQKRVAVRAVIDPRYHENNWWRRKEGFLDLFNSYLALGYSCANGDTGSLLPEMNVEEYVGLLDSRK